MIREKSDKKARKFRRIGDDLYEKKEFCKALLAFNHSLLFAKGSVELASSYGSRAGAYYALQEYQLCLENIKSACDHGCPQVNINIFDDLVKECLELLKNQKKTESNDPSELFKMSLPASPTNPCLAKCLELKKSGKFSKFIVTNKDLKPGDVIAVIEPVFLIVDKRARLHHCTHCGKSWKILSLIPCSGCTRGKYFKYFSSVLLSKNSFQPCTAHKNAWTWIVRSFISSSAALRNTITTNRRI